MSGRCREERGSALIAAIVLIGVMMSIGLATASYVDGQQTQSGGERTRESAFNLAEAALGAQVLQRIARQLAVDGGHGMAGVLYALVDFRRRYMSRRRQPRRELQDARLQLGSLPGRGLLRPGLEDDRARRLGRRRSATTAPPRRPEPPSRRGTRTGTAACGSSPPGRPAASSGPSSRRSSRETRLLSFPHNALTANWVHILNNGRKVLINTQGEAAQTAYVVLRCTAPLGWSPCPPADPGQIGPGAREAPTPAARRWPPRWETWRPSRPWRVKLKHLLPGGHLPAVACRHRRVRRGLHRLQHERQRQQRQRARATSTSARARCRWAETPGSTGWSTWATSRGPRERS
ncbi:MAG: pilus assembly PilX N-terminal domain-containing protein [Thermoleophilaceae bacterium]